MRDPSVTEYKHSNVFLLVATSRLYGFACAFILKNSGIGIDGLMCRDQTKFVECHQISYASEVLHDFLLSDELRWSRRKVIGKFHDRIFGEHLHQIECFELTRLLRKRCNLSSIRSGMFMVLSVYLKLHLRPCSDRIIFTTGVGLPRLRRCPWDRPDRGARGALARVHPPQQPGQAALTLIPVDSNSIAIASVIALRAVLDAG
jgi:hypothetical protein